MSVEAAISNLQTKALALTGMKAAPDAPPESINVFPFSLAYENSGQLTNWMSNFGDELSIIFVEFHVTNQLLATAITVAYALRDPFIKSVMSDPKLGSTVDTLQTISWEFGRLEYGGIQTIGYRFSIGVKVMLTP